MKRATIIGIFLFFSSMPALADIPSSRYFHTGNGRIDIASAKSKAHYKGVYRNADGAHNEAAIREISRIFQAPYGKISPRLIEFFDFLEDNLNPGAKITVVSGYRSPSYNTKLRENGKLAAKASLHQYGMAADMKIAGVSSERVWNFIKGLKFGGAGFYHGGLVHVDVGPARSWDEATSGVGTDISEDNKLIALETDKDIYLAGEQIELTFTRMTAFPIGVNSKFELEGLKNPIPLKMQSSVECPKFSDIEQMSRLSLRLPPDLKPGRYKIRARFCEKEWKDMSAEIATPEFEVR